MVPTIVAVIGDTHIGSNIGLAPLRFEVHKRNADETQLTFASPAQRWLNECWTDYWQYVLHLRGKKNRLVVVHLGDVIDGNHHGTTQIVQEEADQLQMAADLLEPIRSVANLFVGILGTGPFHTGVDHSLETRFYKDLGADYIEQSIALKINGITMDFAHHGRSGSRPWTSAAAALGAEVALDYAMEGTELPRYIFRGHRHVFDDSGEKLAATRVIQCPAWQLKTSYGWKISSNTQRSDIGGVIVINDVLDLSKIRYKGQVDGRKIIEI